MARPLKPFALFLFALALAAAAAAEAQQPTSSPSPMPSAASPSPSVSPSPSPTPVATPTILMLPPNDPPQIVWYSLSSTTPHAGSVLSVIVLTSSNVASVELRIGGFSINLPKTDVGHFEGSYPVPNIPFFVSHKLTMLVIARNTAGIATEDRIAMHFR
jgi:hypothetical protein